MDKKINKIFYVEICENYEKWKMEKMVKMEKEKIFSCAVGSL